MIQAEQLLNQHNPVRPSTAEDTLDTSTNGSAPQTQTELASDEASAAETGAARLDDLDEEELSDCLLDHLSRSYIVKMRQRIRSGGEKPSYPPSAYCLFSERRRGQLRSGEDKMDPSSILQRVKREWKSLPDKVAIKREASVLYQEYKKLMAEWRAMKASEEATKEASEKEEVATRTRSHTVKPEVVAMTRKRVTKLTLGKRQALAPIDEIFARSEPQSQGSHEPRKCFTFTKPGNASTKVPEDCLPYRLDFQSKIRKASQDPDLEILQNFKRPQNVRPRITYVRTQQTIACASKPPILKLMPKGSIPHQTTAAQVNRLSALLREARDRSGQKPSQAYLPHRVQPQLSLLSTIELGKPSQMYNQNTAGSRPSWTNNIGPQRQRPGPCYASLGEANQACREGTFWMGLIARLPEHSN